MIAESGGFARDAHPNSVDFILEQARKYPGQVTLVAIGPLPIVSRERSTALTNGYNTMFGATIDQSMSTTIGSSPKTTPVRGADGTWYVTDGTPGRILALNGTTLAPLYFISGQTVTDDSPNLDCNRERPGRGGILYARDATSVTAYIVDSKGIDTTAPWPRFQHDPSNSGNANTSLAPFACP